MTYVLDVIVIGWNEGEHLERSLTAALAGLRRFHEETGQEGRLLYVDSFSSDSSVEIARRLGVQVVFSPEIYKTCSSARTTGFLMTGGKYVMFLDGDMELAPGWLPEAVRFMEAHSQAGAVLGVRDDMRLFQGKFTSIENFFNVVHPVETDLHDIGGAVLFRREALEQLGGIEPAVAPEEDYVLYCQMKEHGWTTFRIKVAMMTHWDTKISSEAGILHHLVTNPRSRVPGVILRYAMLNTVWWPEYLLRFKGNLLVHFIWLLGLLFFAILPERGVLLAGWIIFYAALLVREKKSVPRGLAAIVLRTAYLWNMLAGLFTGRPALSFGVQKTSAYRDEIRRVNPGVIW